jgi:hypothetical protein
MQLLDLLRRTGCTFGWTWTLPTFGGKMTDPNLIIVLRNHKTVDGLFGILKFNSFQCFTVENLAKAIPAGLYDVAFDYSPRFNAIMPHIIVPVRDQEAGGDAGIRIHPANLPEQLEGCIAVGDQEEPDAVDNSRVTFNMLFKLINGVTGLKIQIFDIPEEVA